MKWLKRLFAKEGEKVVRPNVPRKDEPLDQRTPVIDDLIKKQSWGLIRNEYLKSAEQATKSEDIRAGLVFYYLVIFLDCNGASNIDMSDKKLKQLGYKRWFYPDSSINKNMLNRFLDLSEKLDCDIGLLKDQFVSECNEKIIRRSSTKPPLSPEKVWEEIKSYMQRTI
jgi:hypothetical protein